MEDDTNSQRDSKSERDEKDENESSSTHDGSTLHEESATGVTIWQLPSQPSLLRESDFYGSKPIELPAEAVEPKSLPSIKYESQPIAYDDKVLKRFSAQKGKKAAKAAPQPDPAKDDSPTPPPDVNLSTMRSDENLRDTFKSAKVDGEVYVIDRDARPGTWISLPQPQKSETASESPSEPPPEKPKPPNPAAIDVQGWRQKVLVGSVLAGLFLGFLDTTIVSVALPTIADDFDNFSDSTWIVTAYLLSYMAFAIIISRLSDIFGRQVVEIGSFLMFLGFSLGCALAPNMITLIICRALQGIGGSGLYSMCIVIAFNAVPPPKIGFVASLLGVILTVGGIAGPLLSGAICNTTTWRWIFYLNLPTGGVALVAFIIAWPRDRSKKTLTKAAFMSIDVLGSLLLVAASVLLVYALTQGGTYVLPWNGTIIIACFAVVGVCFVAFVAWQLWLTAHPDFPVKVTFPVKVIVTDRVIGAAVL